MSKKSADSSRAARAQAALDAQAAGERRRRLLIVGAVVAVLAVVVGIGFAISAGKDTTGEAPSTTPTGVNDDYGVVLGQDDAPTTITIYEDLQCPVCQVFEGQTSDAVASAVDAGKVKVEYRMVAFLDGASTTAYSSRALNALMVVLDTSGTDVFADFHRLLYENQPAEGSAGLSDDQLIGYAVEAGAEESAVRGPIEDDAFHQWVVNATDQMSKNGVNGTPTVLIDGDVAGKTPQESAEAVLDAVG